MKSRSISFAICVVAFLVVGLASAQQGRSAGQDPRAGLEAGFRDAGGAEFADLRGADLATLIGLLANSRSPADTPAHCGVEVLTVMATHDTSAPPPPQ